MRSVRLGKKQQRNGLDSHHRQDVRYLREKLCYARVVGFELHDAVEQVMTF